MLDAPDHTKRCPGFIDRTDLVIDQMAAKRGLPNQISVDIGSLS